MQFIYKRELSESIPLETAADFVHVARKFDVPGFLDNCIKSLLLSVSPETVLEIKEVAEKCNLIEDLLPACWEMIENNTREVLEQNFHNLETDNFIEILRNDHLKSPEVELLKCVFG